MTYSTRKSTYNIPDGATTDIKEVTGLFHDAFSNAPDSTFLESIYQWWETKDFLTADQYNALVKIAMLGHEQQDNGR